MKYDELRRQVLDGDLVAVRSNHGGMPRLIRRITGSPYTHTAIAIWLDLGLWVAEMDGAKNVLVPLSQYAHLPFDVYRCPVPRAAVREAVLEQLSGKVGYDWLEILAIGARRLFGLKLREHGHRKVCNSYSAAAWLSAGWAAELPELASPGDLVAAIGAPPALVNEP